MQITLNFPSGHAFDILLHVVVDKGIVSYHARLDSAFLSFFDHTAEYSGESIESAIYKISRAISNALEQALNY